MNQESFSELLTEMNSTATSGRGVIGKVLKGIVVVNKDNMVLVDVGLKAEGWVPVSEFRHNGVTDIPNVGDEIDVYVEKLEDKDGLAVLSRERARREEAWIDLENKQQKEEKVAGVIVGHIRGGYTVELNGAVAFLPGSQVDIRPLHDVSILMNEPQDFQILKMNRARGNIVVSRRAVIEKSRDAQRSELFSNLEQGQILEGVVKNITDYGAFVDLGGVDGLLHVTDMSWKRIPHPSEKVTVGETIKVKIIRYNSDNNRVSLGMKQLIPDPWEGIELKYPVDAVLTGKVSNITDYGVFVVLEDGVEGLIHISELSWNKKNVHPSKITAVGEEIEFVIMEIDLQKRRISLGHKQRLPNPWSDFAKDHNAGDKLKGKIRNITEFGLFISIKDVEGMVHSSDVSWDRPAGKTDWSANFEKGQDIDVVLLSIDTVKNRISLGIKQLLDDPIQEKLTNLSKGDVVTCMIQQVLASGLAVTVDGDIKGFIKRAELSRVRAEQRTDRYAVGEKIDAQIIVLNTNKRDLNLSVKARELSEMKTAMKTYGSTDSGASLGDILSEALKNKAATEESKTEAENKESSVKASDSKDNETIENTDTVAKTDTGSVKKAQSKKSDTAEKAETKKSAKTTKDSKDKDIKTKTEDEDTEDMEEVGEKDADKT